MKKKRNLTKKKSKSTGRQKKHRVVFSTGDAPPVERSREERLRDQCAALSVLGRAVIAGLEQQDRRDRALEALYEYNEIGTVRAGEKATAALRDVLDEG